jgi:hypothetical protein
MAPGAEYFQIGSYWGFQILARRRPSSGDALFPPVEGFLCLPDGRLLYPFKFGDSEQGVIQSIDAQLRAIDLHLDRAQKNRDELKHRQELIERELARGWGYARRYEELQEQFLRVNQLLKEDGSQIDDKQEFIALDEDAFGDCEPAVEESVQLSETVSPPLIGATVPEMPDEPAPDHVAPTQAEEKELSRTATTAIALDPSCGQLTLDDLRNQARLTDKRKPSAAPRTSQPAQLSLWK